MITRRELFGQFEEIGLPRDVPVAVHTSLRAVGEIEGRGEGLLDALIAWVTRDRLPDGGLLCVPTHTWNRLGGPEPVTLDMNDERTCVGTLPTLSLRRPDVLRTLHPTHSMAVFGDPEKAKEAARRYADTAVLMGVTVMMLAGAILYAAAPAIFAMLTPDERVRELGVTVLRIEAFAEPLYGASIVCSGAMRGAGDTLIPSIMNLASMWGVRIPLGFILVRRIGLAGYWIAMATELCFRGIIFLIRMLRGGWLKKGVRI